MPHNIEQWELLIPKCRYLSQIELSLTNNENLPLDNLKKLAYFAVRFGEGGKKRLRIIALQSNHSIEEIDGIWNDVENENLDESLICTKICGINKRCKYMSATDGSTPFSLPTETFIKYCETDAVTTFEKYFGRDILYHSITQRFYEYKQGVWKVIVDQKVSMLFESLLCIIYDDSLITDSIVKAATNRLKSRSELFFGDEFNNDKFILNFKNGLYDLRNNKLLPHSREYKTTVQFPVEYDPDAKCELFLEKLNEIFDTNEDVINHFLKWMLYTLMPTYEFQKALLLLGKGGNGKSVLMDVWAELLGHDNVSNQEFSKLANDSHYSVYQLVNKYANFSKEISTLEKETHIFKALTGNDIMSARQIYGKPVDFRNKARLIISANQLPNFKVLDSAILRRFDIIKFEKSFHNNADTMLNVKLKKELSGILNLVLSKSKDIINGDGSVFFRPPESVSINLDLFKSQSSSVSEFVSEWCILSKDDNGDYVTTLKYLYESYVEWCMNEMNSRPKPKNVFKEEVENLFDCVTFNVNSAEALSGKIHKKCNWVLGIRLQNPDEDSTAIGGPIRNVLGLPDLVVNESESNTPVILRLTGTDN